MKNIRIKWKPLLIIIGATILAGLLAELIALPGIADYGQLNKPPLAPPAPIFPIVWTILYVLMGYGLYRFIQTAIGAARQGILAYCVQLFLNFCWTLVFFLPGWYWIGFFLALLMLTAVIYMAALFAQADKLAALLQIPYILWLLFTVFLNIGIAILN